MNKRAFLMRIAAVGVWVVSPAMADVGVTDACQDDIRELEEKISDNKDDYTMESRRKAQTQLMAAKTNRLNPVKCRKNILDARKELQEGKRDKKKKDKD
jgi:hypothetical protein